MAPSSSGANRPIVSEANVAPASTVTYRATILPRTMRRQKRAQARPSGQFRFIVSDASASVQSKDARRMARSHAISHALAKKRKTQRDSGANFRPVFPDHSIPASGFCQRSTAGGTPPLPLAVVTKSPSPLQTLTEFSPKLRSLLHSSLNRDNAATFTVSDELVLRNFGSILRNGLDDDDALFSTVMFTFVCAVTSGGLEKECLGLQTEVFTSIRQRMSCPAQLTSEMTLGAILLLAGIEARLGAGADHVRLHMGAIRQLLYMCQDKGSYLGEGIKRAIFWQDLDLSLMTGSPRIVSHKTFPELAWRRNFLPSQWFAMPPGFQRLLPLLGEEFVEVLEDIHALQCVRESALFEREDAMSMAQIDNHQASIQSRLTGLPEGSLLSQCCHLGAYLCSAMLRCKMWRTSTVPSHISLRLLRKLEQSSTEQEPWDEHSRLLVWLLYIGGAFAPDGMIRQGYIGLLCSRHFDGYKELWASWPELHEMMKCFIWSDNAFKSQVEVFWEEVH